MINLEQLLTFEFEGADLNKIVKKLAHHRLYKILMQSINIINEHIAKKDEEIRCFGVIQVAHIASVILVAINERLRKLKTSGKIEDKEILEYYLGNIMKRILKSVVDSVPFSVKQFQLLSIQYSLEDACKLYKYDFEELSRFIQIDDLVREVYVEYSKDNNINISEQKRLPGFRPCAKHNNKNISKLLDLIKELEISFEINKIELLFRHPERNLAISFNEKRATYVMQFWAAMSTALIIESDHEKYGFYQVLECHVLNFKEIFLKGKDGQRGADRVKRLKDWNERKVEFDNHFKKLI